jgi:hypothetical protein
MPPPFLLPLSSSSPLPSPPAPSVTLTSARLSPASCTCRICLACLHVCLCACVSVGLCGCLEVWVSRSVLTRLSQPISVKALTRRVSCLDVSASLPVFFLILLFAGMHVCMHASQLHSTKHTFHTHTHTHRTSGASTHHATSIRYPTTLPHPIASTRPSTTVLHPPHIYPTSFLSQTISSSQIAHRIHDSLAGRLPDDT